MSPAVLAAVLAALAVLALTARGSAARRRLAALTSRAGTGAVAGPRHGSGARAGSSRTGGAGSAASVAALAELVASVARAGLAPARTWALVAARPGVHAAAARGTARRVELGLPAGAALLRAGRTRPGAELLALAVALEVCERAGAPTSEVLEALARALRAQEAARQDREAALAAPRATAAVMAVLPMGGLAMGALLGVDTVGTLLGTPAGRACLALGGALWWAGRRWTRRLVDVAAAAGGPG